MDRDQRALLVEDNLLVLELLAEAVGELGYRVTQAMDGNSAIAAMESETFDLLIADQRLPGGVSGTDLAHRFRAAFPTAPVLLTSGEPIVGALPVAGSSFLQKPFTLPRLRAALAGEMVGA